MKTKTLINVIPYEDDTRYKRVTYEQVKKACGKRSCRTCGGERLAHGPYWYRAEWDADGRKKRTVYVGKELPPEAEDALLAKRFLSDPYVPRPCASDPRPAKPSSPVARKRMSSCTRRSQDSKPSSSRRESKPQESISLVPCDWSEQRRCTASLPPSNTRTTTRRPLK